VESNLKNEAGYVELQKQEKLYQLALKLRDIIERFQKILHKGSSLKIWSLIGSFARQKNQKFPH
jgi:hypothetical protein